MHFFKIKPSFYFYFTAEMFVSVTCVLCVLCWLCYWEVIVKLEHCYYSILIYIQSIFFLTDYVKYIHWYLIIYWSDADQQSSKIHSFPKRNSFTCKIIYVRSTRLFLCLFSGECVDGAGCSSSEQRLCSKRW